MADCTSLKRKKMDVSTLKVFISHSNKAEDYKLINTVVIPKLKQNNITVNGQNEFIPGQTLLPSITKKIEEADRTLLFISKNALESPWCSFELLISLERAQRTNLLSVVLLLHGVEESEIPHIGVLQEAPKIYFSKGQDDWVGLAVECLRENKIITKDVMPAGNVAHGLVWSHFTGFLQYVLPELKEKIKDSEWYKQQSEDVQSRLSWKLYELVPRSCACKYNLPEEDKNIKLETTITISVTLRAGTDRKYLVNLYSVTNGEETYYCVCEYPNVIGTMKVMEDNHLAKFCHNYPATTDNLGKETAVPFTMDDKKIQLGRFYYTMNSVLGHFDNCRDYARVLLFNDVDDETQVKRPTVSEVLIEAIKEDVLQTNKLKKDFQSPKVEKLESTEEFNYEYQVYVAHTDHSEDEKKATEIEEYLRENKIDKILCDTPGLSFSQNLLLAAQKCRWFVILLTKNALDNDKLTFTTIAALGDSIYRRKVRVIPVVDCKEELYIPEALQWVTYIPFDDGRNHLKSLYNIVSGRDIPMETQLLLPAGDVAYGLAWGFVANYLNKVLPEVLVEGISPAFRDKNIVDYRCPQKLYVVIPKSCDAQGALKDRKDYPGRISNFTKTAEVHPYGSARPISCNIYKVSTNHRPDEPDLYFVGQYAAPVTCLDDMKEMKIAGMTALTMESEAHRFYEIVRKLTENALLEKSKYCEFVYFDDENESLADIMEKKIRSVGEQARPTVQS